jgi:hypothetical protein
MLVCHTGELCRQNATRDICLQVQYPDDPIEANNAVYQHPVFKSNCVHKHRAPDKREISFTIVGGKTSLPLPQKEHTYW